MRISRMMFLVLPGAFLLSLSTAGQSQETGYDSLNFQIKSENTALLYSGLGTLTPVGLGLAVSDGSVFKVAATGIIVGPSLGYFYGGEPGRGLRGITIRLGVAAGSFLVGNAMGLEINLFGGSGADDDGWPVVFVGALFVLSHGIYDIARVRGVVRENNLEIIRRNQASVIVMPKYFADSGAGGLELRVAF